MLIVAVVGGIIIIWVIIGQNLFPSGSVGTSPGGTGGTPSGGGKCDVCESDQAAYQSWSQAKQLAGAAAWGIKWTACRAKGCL